ncbi:MAG: MBL fold metallo-hydrolase [bacterium]
MDRRTFVATAAALAPGFQVLANNSPPQPPSRAGTRLILLGTAGGPRPRATRGSPAQVIIANGAAYVVDCGNGVTRQLVIAGVPLRTIRGVFVTHHHSDHNADYGTLLLLAWTAGLAVPIDTWAPPPLTRITEAFFDMSATDIDARIQDEGRPDLRTLVRAHEVRVGGRIFEDANVKVTVAIVDHPPLPALAYRLDTADRSIVISGDTRYSEPLIALARGADVLVHEAMIPEAVDRLVANVPNASDLKRSILSHHTSAEDAGRVAQAAGVGTLVLSHLVPAEDASVSEAVWIEAASRHFHGRVILGRDLLEV